MKKINLDRDWKFILEKDCGCFPAHGYRKCGTATGPAAFDYHEGLMRTVDLPHDWGIELMPDKRANTGNGARPISRYVPLTRSSDGDSHIESASVGWYRKHLTFDTVLPHQRVFLEFEGVFRDYSVFINGIYIDRHNSGYTAAVFDITDQIDRTGHNVLAVRVDAAQPEGWWYEGAGIYRHVHLLIKDTVYIPAYTTSIQPKNSGEVYFCTKLCNASDTTQALQLQCNILDKNATCVATTKFDVTLAPQEEQACSGICRVPEPSLWELDSPYLYTAELWITTDVPHVADRVRFGFREITFDPNYGMFLNGKHVKVRGACIHQDFGGFGVALPTKIARYKIKLLKSMGVNAYRSSHHPASEDILTACDELGMLVIDEARLFGSSAEALRQIEAMVCQHRNHPCIFLWSLGNEEYEGLLQSTDYGKRMAGTAYTHLKRFDNTRHVTFGANNGCVDRGVNALVDVRGFNYIRNLERLTRDENGKHLPGYHADRYHAEHPNAVMLGTEECSYFLCRDAGFDDFKKGQVVATGENTSMGGSTPEGWVKFYEKRDYIVGGFMWTGIDYYGEPSPFTDINLSSSFGAIDLVGFPKNSYYYYRSCWLDEPILKIMPHWDFKKGDRVKVAVYTNCDRVELYLNQNKIGQKSLEKFDSAIWEVPFEAGRLEAVGEKDGVIYRTHIDTPQAPQKLCLRPDQQCVRTDDTVIVDVTVTDRNGVICCGSDTEVSFDVLGSGKIVAVGNGNPASFEADRFLEQVKYRDISNFYVTRSGASKERYEIPHESDLTGVETVPCIDSKFKSVTYESKQSRYEDDHRLVWQCRSGREVDQEAVFEAEIKDAEDFEFIQFERFFGHFKVYLNGELIGKSFDDAHRQTSILHQATPYRFECGFRQGVNRLEVRMHGPNTAQLGIYNGVRIGKYVSPTWKRKTFYGKLRVFLKAEKAGSVTLRAKTGDLAVAPLTITVLDSDG